MRWEDELFELFDDLEAQASVLHDLEREAELADRSRAEYRHVTLASRLAASTGREVALEVTGVGRLVGELRRTGDGWCLLRGHQQDWIVSTGQVRVVHGASQRSLPEVAWSPLQRLGVGSALRGLAEQRLRCILHLVDGTTREIVLRRVGEDFAEFEAPSGADLLVPYAAIAAVQSRD